MGRKSISKKRIVNPGKKIAWVVQLIPFFQDRGLKEPTMDDIAHHLNKSKATVYKYFHSKEEIIELLLTYKLSEMQRFESILNDDTVNFVERYFEAIKIIVQNVSDISNRFVKDLKHVFPGLWNQVDQFIGNALSTLKIYYDSGIEQGILNPVHSSILLAADQMLFSFITSPEFLHENNLTLKEAFESYFQMKCYGMIGK